MSETDLRTEIERPRVALVAYFFPPVGGVAVARTMGFVRHLPAAGWTPVVIAARGSAYGLVDPAGRATTPETLEVHRSLSPEPGHLRRLGQWLASMAPSQRGGQADSPASAGQASAGQASAEPSRSGPPPARRTSLASRIRNIVWFPDDQVGWLPFAVVSILRAHRRRRLDAIESSSSPITAHLAAGIASGLLRIPWVADFRDPWVDNPIELERGRFDRWRRRRVEAWIARRATWMVFATRSLLDEYATRYASRAARFVTIENGYELSDLGDVTRSTAPGDGRRLLVYAGSLYRPGELDTFLRGLALLVERSPDLPERLAIEFIGYASPDCNSVAAAYLADPAVAAIVTFVPFMPRADALRRLAAADAALTLLGPGPGMGMFVGAKLFDALGLNLQVVAMLPPGDARTLLSDLDWGIVADPEPGSVADALERFLEEPIPDRAADPGHLYDRAALAGRLGKVLDRATGRIARAAGP
jgi:glycosyltransferase involved in cell wall biosynthesis